MRTLRTALLTVVLTLLSATALAAPAQADHVAELWPDEGYCKMGALESRIGVDIRTSDYKHIVDRNGNTTGYVCHFRDLPPRDQWYPGPLSDGAYTNAGFGCWLPYAQRDGLFYEGRINRWTATPSGNGTLVCMF